MKNILTFDIEGGFLMQNISKNSQIFQKY